MPHGLSAKRPCRSPPLGDRVDRLTSCLLNVPAPVQRRRGTHHGRPAWSFLQKWGKHVRVHRQASGGPPVGRDADECMADMSMCHPLAITVEGATGLTVAEAPERERSSHGCWRLKQLGW